MYHPASGAGEHPQSAIIICAESAHSLFLLHPSLLYPSVLNSVQQGSMKLVCFIKQNHIPDPAVVLKLLNPAMNMLLDHTVVAANLTPFQFSDFQ